MIPNVCSGVSRTNREKRGVTSEKTNADEEGEKNHANHCSLYSRAGAMCIKPKSINKTLKSPLFHFKGNGCFNHMDCFFVVVVYLFVFLVKDLAFH